MESTFRGKIGITYKDSEPDWLSPTSPPGDAPNVLVILLDDTGFGNLGCYGSTIETPNMDALAENGLRYNNFHVTPLCSPTRASLLTGRNHHAVGMSTIVDGGDAGFPNRRSRVSRHAATLAEMLGEEGFATFALGKWHLNPSTQNSAGGPHDEWPLQRGFDRFFGYRKPGQASSSIRMYNRTPDRPPARYRSTGQHTPDTYRRQRHQSEWWPIWCHEHWSKPSAQCCKRWPNRRRENRSASARRRL